jgi:hypothetical protein
MCSLNWTNDFRGDGFRSKLAQYQGLSKFNKLQNSQKT